MADLPELVHETVLILRCQAGDAAAFEKIVSRYGSRLRYYLLKILSCPEAAEDTVQDVWLDVYRGLPRLRRPDSFRPWLYRIARDRAFRALRVSRPRVPLSCAEHLAAAEAKEEEFTAEDAAHIHHALDGLSTEHREMLLLRFIEDLSYDEIAEITGCNLGTVKSRIHYAKRLLRRQMEGLSDHE
jgi:RNA polymerase sigma-70 factor (ECF subfamily)